jgi:hypothetical protein
MQVLCGMLDDIGGRFNSGCEKVAKSRNMCFCQGVTEQLIKTSRECFI